MMALATIVEAHGHCHDGTPMYTLPCRYRFICEVKIPPWRCSGFRDEDREMDKSVVLIDVVAVDQSAVRQ